MNLIVSALKQKLAPFGWAEAVRRGGDQRAAPVSAVSRGAAAQRAGRLWRPHKGTDVNSCTNRQPTYSPTLCSTSTSG